MIPFQSHRMIEIFNFSFAPHGFLVAFGALIAILFILREARKQKIEPRIIVNLIVWIIVGAFLGSKIGHMVLPSCRTYSYNPLTSGFWKGGYAWYGGLIGAVIFAFAYSKRNKLNFWKYMDIIGLYLPLAYFFGRIGCFLVHDSPGTITNVPWALNINGTLRHPFALYDSFFSGLVVFLILYNLKDKKRFHGFIALSFLMLYAAGRFITDFFRDYTSFSGFYILGLAVSQLIGIILFIPAAIIFYKKYKG